MLAHASVGGEPGINTHPQVPKQIGHGSLPSVGQNDSRLAKSNMISIIESVGANALTARLADTAMTASGYLPVFLNWQLEALIRTTDLRTNCQSVVVGPRFDGNQVHAPQSRIYQKGRSPPFPMLVVDTWPRRSSIRIATSRLSSTAAGLVRLIGDLR